MNRVTTSVPADKISWVNSAAIMSFLFLEGEEKGRGIIVLERS